MMDELSLNILDIAQNSISAGAKVVEISVIEDVDSDKIIISVKDNGKGMSADFLKLVENPFITTRTTRKVGLGISFLKEAAEITGGSLEIISELGIGTTITANFVLSHIDRQPIGNLSETIITLITLNPDIDFIIDYKTNNEDFFISTAEVKAHIGEDAKLSSPPIREFLSEYVSEHIQSLNGSAF